MKNPKAVGELSEVIILAELIKLGYSVSLPFGDNQRYDMIIDDNGTLFRAQCKTGRLRNGSIKTKICSHNPFTNVRKNYLGEIDLFLIYCPDTNQVFKIPINKTGNIAFNLRVEPVKANHSRINWAKDYLLK